MANCRIDSTCSWRFSGASAFGWDSGEGAGLLRRSSIDAQILLGTGFGAAGAGRVGALKLNAIAFEQRVDLWIVLAVLDQIVSQGLHGPLLQLHDCEICPQETHLPVGADINKAQDE